MKLTLNEDRVRKYALRFVCQRLSVRCSGRRLKKEVMEEIDELRSEIEKGPRWKRGKGNVNRSIKDRVATLAAKQDGETVRGRWFNLLEPRVVKEFNRFRRVRGMARNAKEEYASVC